MRRKLLLTLALAVLGTAITAGVVNAQPGQTSTTGGDPPGGQNQPPVSSYPACSDLKDNDGDGLTDSSDPGCSGSMDPDESDTAPPPPPPDPGPGGGGTGGGTGGGGGGGGGGGTGGYTGGGGGAGPAGPGGSGGHGVPGGGGNGSGGTSAGSSEQPTPAHQPTRKPNGVPTKANPTLTVADFGPAPLGVPSFLIDQFSIPPFLLPIYQACGTQYGIPWEVLAGINRIETAFGTNLNVSTAGAVGWMQFIPSTWKAYGVDANGDGRKDPYNPVDAICAAGRYLKAAGGAGDLRTAIFAYNHADWYVDEVLLYAGQYGKLPEDLVGSLTGLTQGDRFPVAADARYADDLSERAAAKRAKPNKGALGNVADVVSSSPTRRGINIYSHDGAPAVAVNDGTIKRIGHNSKLGQYVVLQDNYGNRFTYSQLGHVSKVYPVPKQHKLSGADFKIVSPKKDKAPTQPATRGKPLGVKSGGSASSDAAKKDAKQSNASANAAPSTAKAPANTEDLRQRLYALPERPHNVDRAGITGQLDHLLSKKFPGYSTFKSYFGGVLHFNRSSMELRPLRKGSQVVAGTVLGRLGKTGKLAPHVNFSIRPAGRGAPKIDPKPILDGWKLLEATAIYRANGKNPFSSAAGISNVTQDLLMPKTQLARKVLADPRLSIYSCGRHDIQTGQVNQRVLAGMEYLVDNGFRLTITSLKCGHSFLTASGNPSAHAFGDAMDIAEVNGIPITGNQGKGTITEVVIKTLLRLQGTLRPQQVISLMTLGGPSFALADHYDHIHVGWSIQGPATKGGAAKATSQQFDSLLKPDQWKKLIGRIAQIDNPTVPTSPSRYSIPTGKGKQKSNQSSRAHVGD
jgi:transglycosylase-like protein with SLT domain